MTVSHPVMINELNSYLMVHSRSLFLYFCLIHTVKSLLYKLLTAGFEPRSSFIGSDHSANVATTTDQSFNIFMLAVPHN